MKRSKIKAFGHKMTRRPHVCKKGWRKCLPDSTLLEFWVDHFNEGPQTANFVKNMKQRRNNVTGVTWEDIKYFDPRNHFKAIKRTRNLHIPGNSFPRKDPGNRSMEFSWNCPWLLVTKIHRVRDKWTQETNNAV